MSKTKPTHDAVAKTGSFTGQDGKTRNAYLTIGAAWPGDDGAINRIKLDSLPINWDGMIYLRERGTTDAEGGAQ